MNLRTAILAAADSIQLHPKLFNFGSIGQPNVECNTPGCALGWIGLYTKAELHTSGNTYVHGLSSIMDVDAETFYNRMDKLPGFTAWRENAASCTESLRLYADKYHPLTVEQACPYETADAA